MTKYACIDTGTNSIRLMLCEFDGTTFTNVSKKLDMTRLGKGVNETHKLAEDRMEASLIAIETFYNDALDFGAEACFIMATSAVRDSENAHVFKDKIKERTGLQLDVISGDLEAEVGFLGVLLGISEPHKNLLVIDIGGGSTELIIGNHEGIIKSVSLNIGAVRLTDLYIENDPPNTEEAQNVKQHIDRVISDFIDIIKVYPIDEVVGIGGTATTFATMVHEVGTYNRATVHGLEVSANAITHMNHKLSQLKNEARKNLAGLEAKRADIIYTGGLILEALLSKLNAHSYSVSDYDNLEGYLAYKLQKKFL